MSTPSRWEVNAAIERLIADESDDWLEAARVVVVFGRTIPPGQVSFTSSVTSKEKLPPVTGYSPGRGNVTVEDKRETTVDRHVGQKIERVGYYKVLHHKGLVSFRHWRNTPLWGEDDDTSLDYVILYEAGGEPHTFAATIWKSAPQWMLAVLSGFHFLRHLGLMVRLLLKNRVWPQMIVRLTFHAGYQVIRSTRPGLSPGDIATSL